SDTVDIYDAGKILERVII
nr:RecName: Full=Methyl-coenzyme M reductase subunit beta; AltName: Full=Coenzyme-B sulfoethylthiotransferase beta [Methanosarcina thermophila]